MAITAAQVKELREATGVGMMECKKALTEHNGDIDAAAEALRKSGAAKADKKADRVTAEGRIGVAQDGGKAVLVEVNSETDFVANDANFKSFVDSVARAALASGAADVEALKAARLASGETVEESRATTIQKLGLPRPFYRLRLDDAGLSVWMAGEQDKPQPSHQYPWQDLHVAYRTPDAVYLYVQQTQAYLVNGEERDAVWDCLKTHLPASRLRDLR